MHLLPSVLHSIQIFRVVPDLSLVGQVDQLGGTELVDGTLYPQVTRERGIVSATSVEIIFHVFLFSVIIPKVQRNSIKSPF